MSIYSEPLGGGENAQDVGLHREKGEMWGSGRQAGGKLGEQEAKGDSNWETMRGRGGSESGRHTTRQLSNEEGNGRSC